MIYEKPVLKSKKQIDKHITEKINESQAEGLVAKDRTDKREFDNIISKSRCKFGHQNLECNYCYKIGHIKANWFKLKID